jgi:hypothetical protein
MSIADILPFPLARRRSFIDRQVRRANELNPMAAERHIAYQIELQRAAMRRRGIHSDLISNELASMERAIRLALSKARQSGGAV